MNDWLTSLNVLDWTIIGITAFLLIWGTFKGFVRSLAALAGIVVGYIAASRLYTQAAPLLTDYIQKNGLRNIIAFAVIFVACVIAVCIAGMLLHKLIKGIGLGWADHVMGAGLGGAKGVLLSAVLIIVLVAFLPAQSNLVSQSHLSPRVMSLVQIIAAAAPPELRTAFNKKLEDVKTLWGQRALDAVLKSVVPTGDTGAQNPIPAPRGNG
jgi:membrane protein required for colicin V production